MVPHFLTSPLPHSAIYPCTPLAPSPSVKMEADRKRKWDEPSGDNSTANTKANDAAAAAAAIAAKIAASLRPGASGNELVKREGYDEGFVKDIEINDLRNRYLLTKGATQKQVGSPLSVTRFRLMLFALDRRRDWCIDYNKRCMDT